MAKTKAKTATTAADSVEHEDLQELLARSERENVGLLQVLEQAQSTQKALVAAQKRIKALEANHAAEHARAVSSLSAERDAAAENAAAVAREREEISEAVAAAAKSARALAASLARMPDPLAPLTADDDGADLDKLRAALREAAERKDADAAMVGDLAARARAVVDAAIARMSLQANRVKLLRKQVESLEAERAAASREADGLREAGQAAQAEAKQTNGRLKESQATLTSLRKELDAAGAKLERTTRSSLDAEAKLLAERDKLANEHKIAKARGDDLAKRLAEARKQLRGAEGLAGDLAQAVIEAGDAMVAAGNVADAPAVKGARKELEELIGDLSDAAEDDLEAALHEDICADLLPATRALSDVLVARHKGLHEELAGLRKTHDKLSAKHESIAAALEQERQAGKAQKTELVRTQAQLKASQQEFDQAAKELAARQRELSEVKGELARLGSEAEALGAQAALAKTLKSELDGTKGELEQTRKAAARSGDALARCEEALGGLGKSLVDLATATEAALAAAGLRPEGAIGRFTRTMRKLEGEVDKPSDALALLRSAGELVDKATARIGHLQAELTRRAEALAKAEAEAAATGKERDELARGLAKREEELRQLREERDELAEGAERAEKLEPALKQREEELAAMASEMKALQAGMKAVRAELDEAKAREAAALESLDQELGQARKRLEDEGQARRAAESAAAELREELEAKSATADAKVEELERTVEAREARITALQKEVAASAELRGRVGEAQRRIESLNAQAAKSTEKIRALEGQLEDAEGSEQLAKDLAAARGERDELATRMRTLEKRLADERGVAASAKTQIESLKRRLEERAAEHQQAGEKLQERCDALAEDNRRLKEQLAGLNARVRTLTAH